MIEQRLKEIGQLSDDEVPVVETLLLLGSLAQGGADLTPYWAHIEELHTALNEEIAAHPDEHRDAHWQLQRMAAVLHGRFNYHGDELHEGFEDPTQINFLDVIDTRCGIPVTLGALYIELGRRQQWQIQGLNFPGHFLIRIEHGSERLIVDPFADGKEMNAGNLRQLLKHVAGPQAELNHEYYNPVTMREVVLRFCNNRKTRFIERAEYQEAMTVVEQELWIAPNEPRLYFDAGVITAKLEHLSHALEYLQKFTEMSKDGKTIAQARAMMATFQRNLH